MIAGGMILRKDSRKTGLDPLFGLPATRDSKAMDCARTRNISYDKQLKSFLKSLEEHASLKNVKTITRQARTKEMLHKIKPDPDKKIVTPIGLNQDQVRTVRLLRRGSLPSMSVQELDHKLSTYRMERGLVKNDKAPSEKPSKGSKNKLTEYKIKRKLYRGNSKSEENKINPANLVENQSTQIVLPLYRRKSLVCEAYQRVTSCDIAHARRPRDRESHKRSQSDSDISVDSSSTVSSSRYLVTSVSNRKQAAAPPRRNTMPEISCDSVLTKRVQFATSLRPNDMQDSSNKNNFECFLSSIKKCDKLPAL